MPPPRASVAETFGWMLVIWTVLVVASVAGTQFVETHAVSTALGILVQGIAPALLAIAATVAVGAKLGCELGLRRATRASLLAGVACTLPLFACYGVIFGVLGIPPTRVPDLELVILKNVVAQGIGEELIFRGFVFARLRPGRTFRQAATLSAVAFAVAHLANFVHGFSAAVIMSVIASTVFAFLLAYPAALLFERGGGSIWPFAIAHVLIDSLNWFLHVAPDGRALAIYLGALVLTAGLGLVLGRRLPPAPAQS